MTDTMTADEMFESLTGFDEIAITKSFGRTVTDLAKTDQMQFIRSLVFIDQRRQGAKDTEAKTKALELTIKDLTAYFPDDPEPMPEDPVTEPGKDALPHDG